MIYFNTEKEAFGFEIENPICMIEDDRWAEYAGTDKWDIIDGEFVDITDTPEYMQKHIPEIIAGYDAALEQHIYDTRVARGYTTREPSYYLQSSVPRWKQDAQDWVAFVDECMLYGLDVQNRYAAGEEVPTLDEFKANLPQIVWTYTEE